MPRLIWSPPALQDVQRLYRFLAVKNVDAAKRAVTAIRVGVKTLELHPEVGKPADDMDLEFREWIIDFGNSGYVVLYRFDKQIILIVAVRHQREVGY